MKLLSTFVLLGGLLAAGPAAAHTLAYDTGDVRIIYNTHGYYDGWHGSWYGHHDRYVHYRHAPYGHAYGHWRHRHHPGCGHDGYRHHSGRRDHHGRGHH